MEKGRDDRRVYALDGVRGIAIILVVLTHINSTYIQPFLPPLLARAFFSSGVTGVSLLFILSGFFMALMYPAPHDRLLFIQKRYTRIFPLFTMMCLLTAIVRTTDFPWYVEVLIGIGLTLLFHFVWVHLIQKFASARMSRLLFLGWIALQILIGSLYFFWVMRQPAIVFNQQWSDFARESMIAAVNGTLTLPLGNYIPMIDGVYWSLAAEVLFYVLYVIVCVPLLRSLVGIKGRFKLFLLILLIPFFGGAHLLAKRMFGFSLLQPEFGYYFVMGILLGSVYRRKASVFETFHKNSKGIFFILPTIFFFACLAFKDQSFQFVDRAFDPWLHILWAIPLTMAVAFSLDPATSLSRLLRSKVFVFLGTISYSMYLSHSLIVHIVEDIIPITDIYTSILAMITVFIATIVGSTFLYTFLEKPYFNRRVKKQESMQTIEKRYSPLFRRPHTILISVLVVFFLTVLIAYQSSFNFFSQAIPIENYTLIEPSGASQAKVDMSTSPKVVLEFVSPHDEFGIVTLKLLHQSRQGVVGKKQRVNFSIKEVGQDTWYATNTYALEEIGASDGDPYGFPVISAAKDKKYHVELSLAESDAPDTATLDFSTLSGVYVVSKKELLKNPLKLVTYTLDRMQNVFKQADAKKVLLYMSPALLCLLAVLMQNWKKSHSTD